MKLTLEDLKEIRVRFLDQVQDQVDFKVCNQVRDQVVDKIQDSVVWHVRTQVHNQVWEIWDQIYEQINF